MSTTINFEVDVLTKKTKIMTDEEKKKNELLRKEKINKIKYVQTHSIFKRLKITHKKYECIENIFNTYYDFAKFSLSQDNKGKVDDKYYKMLKIDFDKEADFKEIIRLSIYQIYIDRNRMASHHFPSNDLMNRKKNGQGVIHPSHPAIQTAVYFLYLFDKKRKYIRKVIKQKKAANKHYNPTSIYGQGSYLMSTLICMTMNLKPVDSFAILFIIDQKTEMQQLNEEYQTFGFSYNFFMMVNFLLIKVIKPNYFQALFDKYSKNNDNFNKIFSEGWKGFNASATMTPGLIVNVVAGIKGFGNEFIQNVEDLCYHLYHKGPSFILCLQAAFNIDVVPDIEKVAAENTELVGGDLPFLAAMISTQGTWNKKTLPVKEALQIYNYMKKTKYKSVNKFLCQIAKFMKQKRFLISTKPMPPKSEPTVMKNLIGIDRHTFKELHRRLFVPDDKKYFIVNYIALNKFKINQNKNKKGGRRKHKTLRKSRKYYDGWELVKKKSKNKTLKRYNY